MNETAVSGVEAARGAAYAVIVADDEPTVVMDALDRLILEVRAEMPCQYWAFRQTCPQRYNEIEKFCPSCTARAELGRMSHADAATRQASST